MPAAAIDTSDRTFLEALRRIQHLADLPENDLAWFASQCAQVRLNPGDAYGTEGTPAAEMFLLLEGEMRARTEANGGRDEFPFVVRAPAVTGVLPFSRMTHYSRTARALVPSWLALFPKELFGQLAHRMPVLTQRLVGIMSDRIRDITAAEQQQEKLAALGKLSAGLSHELNNPASAARRSVTEMQEAVRALLNANVSLDERPLTVLQRQYLACAERETIEDAGNWPVLDALTRADREEAVAGWLERHGVADAWRLAPALVETDWSDEDLSDLAERFDPADLPSVLARLTSTMSVVHLLTQIDSATSRISSLVDTVREYSHMDRTPETEIDVCRGIDATLAMLGHRLGPQVTVTRDYDPATPCVIAHGGALNQVWTNLIENALDAMPGGGSLQLLTKREDDMVLVEVVDNGRGVPDALRRRIFEPFVTTKPPGAGPGLGLDTVLRIVRHHNGHVSFESRPGETRFQVRLPIRRTYGV